jgi:hypothetical protein
MTHPFRTLEGVFEAPLDGHLGPFGIPAMSQQFYEMDVSRGFIRGYTLLLERSFGPLHQAWGSFSGHPIAWGEDHHEAMRQRFPHLIRVTVMGECWNTVGICRAKPCRQRVQQTFWTAAVSLRTI